MTTVKRSEIAPLTGLRGLAAMLVVAAHYTQWAAVAPLTTQPAWIPQCSGAAATLGMSIFFTLSGFVIALTYSDWDWDSRPVFNLTRLFYYRLARLYPAFFVFALLIWIRTPKLHDLTNPETQGYVLVHLLLWQTWWPLKFDGVTAAGSAFHVSWSLSTECMLYLLFGLGAIALAMLPRKRGLAYIGTALFLVTVLALLGASWWLRESTAPNGWSEVDWNFWLFYLSPYARSFEFCLGIGAYRLFRLPLSTGLRRIASEAGGAGLAIAFVLKATNVIQWGFLPFNLLVGLATSLLMAGALSDSVTNRLLSGRTIVYVGTISYSLYLFHFIVPGLASPGWFEHLDFSIVPHYVVHILASLALAIALATGIYRLVEVPGRRAIRAAADRLLGIQGAPIVRERRAPAAE